MSNEREKVIGELVVLQRGTTYKGPLVGEEGPALLGLGSIEPGGGFRMDFKTYGGDCPEKLMLKSGDIYVALKGATKDGSMVGSVARLPPQVPSGRLTQDTARLDFLDDDPELRRHVYWQLRTPQYRQYCAGRVIGSASASFSREDFLNYTIPPITKQSKTLALLFDAIEDKIELNRRMNGTLEALAQAVFKEWFVEKAEEGWETMMLDEVAYYRNGLALQKFRPKEGEEPLPAIKIAQMRTGLPDSGEWASPNIDPECILYDGDVVFSWSGSLMAILWCGGKAALNQHLFKVTSDKFPKWFYYLWTQQYMPEFQGIASNKATTMGHINRNHLKVPVPIPPAALLKRGDEVIAPLLDRMVANNLETRTLTALRDTLLPKLMRGEVRVRSGQASQHTAYSDLQEM